MTLPRFTLQYKNFSQEDLKLFIKARNGRRMRKNASKKSLVEVLETLDESVTFRFMDLPPEMRNLVYEEVLVHNLWEGRKAYPELLRTSELVHKEGSGILEAGKVIFLDAVFFCNSRLNAGNISLKGDITYKDGCYTLQEDYEDHLRLELARFRPIPALKIKMRVAATAWVHGQRYSFPKIECLFDIITRLVDRTGRLDVECKIGTGPVVPGALASLVAYCKARCAAKDIKLQFNGLTQDLEPAAI